MAGWGWRVAPVKPSFRRAWTTGRRFTIVGGILTALFLLGYAKP